MAKFNKIHVPADESENSVLGRDQAIEIDKGIIKNKKLARPCCNTLVRHSTRNRKNQEMLQRV